MRYIPKLLGTCSRLRWDCLLAVCACCLTGAASPVGVVRVQREETVDTFVILPIQQDGIEFYADTGDLVQAQHWLSELQAVMQRTDNPVGAAALLQEEGMVWVASGKLEQAIPKLRQAVEAWSNLPRRYQQALASQRLAQVLLERTRKSSSNRFIAQSAREEAELLLDKALVVYEDLQIPAGQQAIQALRSRMHLDAQRKRRQTLERQHPFQGLTQRERQVLLQLKVLWQTLMCVADSDRRLFRSLPIIAHH